MIPHVHLPATANSPRCTHCGEAPHILKDCPAALSPEDTRTQFLATRKALAAAQEELAGWRQAAHDLGVSEPQHLGDVLITKAGSEDLNRLIDLPFYPPPKPSLPKTPGLYWWQEKPGEEYQFVRIKPVGPDLTVHIDGNGRSPHISRLPLEAWHHIYLIGLWVVIAQPKP